MVGFDIDMTKELVKIMNKNGGNYSYKFKALSFDAISSSITSDQVDLGISGFTYHKDWKNILWSHAYNTSEQIALVKGDSTFSKASDLEGKKDWCSVRCYWCRSLQKILKVLKLLQ